MADVPTTDKVEYSFDEAARVRVREALAIVDMVHEGKPQCRLCGQISNRLDEFGLCSKTSDPHTAWRAEARALHRVSAR